MNTNLNFIYKCNLSTYPYYYHYIMYYYIIIIIHKLSILLNADLKNKHISCHFILGLIAIVYIYIYV